MLTGLNKSKQIIIIIISSSSSSSSMAGGAVIHHSVQNETKPECVMAVEVVSVKSFVADEAEVIIQPQGGRVVDFRFQHNLATVTHTLSAVG